MHSTEDMSLCDHKSSENASKSQLPAGFLLPNSTYGQETTSQASNARFQNGFSSKVLPVKTRRNIIDLQLPPDEITFKRSKSGRGEASPHQSNSSGSCLDVKSSNGLLPDLNEPLVWQDSEPLPPSKDTYSQYGRHNADLQGQRLEKNTSQNGCMVLHAGHGSSTQRDLHLPSHSVQVRSNNAVQPQSYPTTYCSNVMEGHSMNPQASYDSYVESSVSSSNGPRLHNDYRPDFVRPWSHWSSSWDNPRNSSHQRSYTVQTNPFMNFFAHERTDSSSEMKSHVFSNGIHHGFSSGQSFENLQGTTKQECSDGLPWLKPKPTYKSEVSNGFFDLNASTNHLMDGTDTGDGLDSVSPQKSLRSFTSCSNNANKLRSIEMHSICKEEHTSLLSHSLCVADQQHKDVNHLLKRDFDINLPCDTSVSVDHHSSKAANIRRYFDLNSCASEDDEDSGLHSSLRVKTKGTFWIDLEAPPTLESEEEEGRESSEGKANEDTWRLMKGQDGNSLDELTKVAAEAIVAISLSGHPDDAASSSTDASSESPLSWFADIITSCGDELESNIDASPEATDLYKEEYSSVEIDYFEAMTLSIHPTKEEDYMPEPLVPENVILEGTGLNKLRRGHARRGRPKRDFQRNTLPGLSSLSRHEVAEDIQLFGGLMRSREYTSGVAAPRNSKRKRLS